MLRRVLALGALCLCLIGGSVVSWAQESCKRVRFTKKPGWTTSGVWSSDGSELLLVDSLNETIWRYSKTGALVGAIGEPLHDIVKNLVPLSARSKGENLLLEVASEGFLVLNKNLNSRPLASRSLLVKSAKGPYSVGSSPYQWEPAGEDVVAFLDIYKAQPDGSQPKSLDGWFGAFVRFPFKDPSNFKVLDEPIPIPDAQRTLMRTGYPYIASIETTAYILSMDVEMKLMKSEAASNEFKPLKAFPPEPRKAPVLPRFLSGQDYVNTLADIEGKSMPVGLYSQGGSLYILWRKPYQQGTRWILSSIDPVRDRYTGSIELPIRANHVTVVPGSENWAFIEKGPVRYYGVQDVSRVLLIPTQQLRAPLRGGRTCG